MDRSLRQEDNGLCSILENVLGLRSPIISAVGFASIASLACACVALSSLPARAEQSCAPKTNAAKILRTKNVNDVDPNWAPPAFIGTSWSLIETRQEGEFLSGVLVNPRGGVLPGRVYVIANEWDCG